MRDANLSLTNLFTLNQEVLMLYAIKRMFSSHPTDKQWSLLMNMINLSINRTYWFRLRTPHKHSKKQYLSELKTKLKNGYFNHISKKEAKAFIKANKCDYDLCMEEIQYNKGRKGLWNNV